MSDLKIAIIGNEALYILDDNSPQQLKDADFWQLTTDEDLTTPNYVRTILLDEEFSGLKTDIADNILWQAKKIIFVSIASGDIPSFVIKTAMQMAEDVKVKYSVIQIKPYLFEGQKRINLYKEIEKILNIHTGYESLKIIDTESFTSIPYSSLNELINKRNDKIKNTIIALTSK